VSDICLEGRSVWHQEFNLVLVDGVLTIRWCTPLNQNVQEHTRSVDCGHGARSLRGLNCDNIGVGAVAVDVVGTNLEQVVITCCQTFQCLRQNKVVNSVNIKRAISVIPLELIAEDCRVADVSIVGKGNPVHLDLTLRGVSAFGWVSHHSRLCSHSCPHGVDR